MFEIKTQGNNERKPMATLGNLKLACVELGIPDDRHTLRRASRAFDLYNSGKVEHLSRKVFALSGESHRVDHTFAVKSQYRERLPYQVHISKSGTSYCTCPDWRNYSGDLVLPDVHFHCKHAISARIWLHHNGNGSKVVNDCGTETAKALQAKLNGSDKKDNGNGTGDNQSPVHHQLDISNPFQESEQRDIDQIEGNGWRVRSHALGDLVHVLSNGEYIISYNGIMSLAEQHGVTFEASRHDETHTVIVHARRGNNTRASGKPANGSSTTAVELAKRNAARQLLPLGEIKALEKKAQLECEFDWEKAKAKCLELLPEANLNIIINDLVNDDKLEQKHPSDYNRKEWLVIFDAVKKDVAQTNYHDGGGDDTPSSSEVSSVPCCICGRTLTKKLSISRCVGPECFKKVGAEGAQFLRDDEVSDELIKASQLYQDEALQKRIVKSCLTLDAPLPVKVLRWLGNEYFGYKNRPILYYVCADGQLNRIDTAKRKLRHAIITRDTAETELDAHGLAQWSTQAKPRLRRVSPAVDVADPSERWSTQASPSASRVTPAGRKAFRRRASASHRAEVPDNVDDFIAKCRELESKVDDTTDDNSVDDTATATMVEGAQMDGDDKRKLQMDKNKNILLIEPDGTETPITMRDAAFTYGSNFILRLTTGIACGGDISTVELD